MGKLTRRQWLAVSGGGAAAALWPGSPSKAVPEDPGDAPMIAIPAGPFRRGTSRAEAERWAERHGCHPSWLSGEVPDETIELPEFLIAKFPVTNAQYARFCAEAPHRPPPGLDLRALVRDKPDHPITFVNHADAVAFAEWSGKRLPTETEWEKAARGPDGLTFPWGGEFDGDRCQWNPDDRPEGGGTAPVNAHPGGASPYGVWDMTGNVQEWCADSPGPATAYLKGGGHICSAPINLRPAVRLFSGWADNRAPFYGFRCAQDAG